VTSDQMAKRRRKQSIPLLEQQERMRESSLTNKVKRFYINPLVSNSELETFRKLPLGFFLELYLFFFHFHPNQNIYCVSIGLF
jgi:hypothetical protein